MAETSPIASEESGHSASAPYFLKLRAYLIPLVARYHRAVPLVIMLFSSSFLIAEALTMIHVHADVQVYQGISKDLLAGHYPYRDRVLEYPPYIIPLVLAPRLMFTPFLGEDGYVYGFMILAFVADWMMKLLLLRAGAGHQGRRSSLMPLFWYSLSIPFLSFFFLQRYDVFPALLSVLAVVWVLKGRYTLCGIAIAIGIGLKVYPAVFVPPLYVLSLRDKNALRFAVGLAIGLLPIAALSFVVPWWRFAAFHGTRGLQAESLYASLLWLGKKLGLLQVICVGVPSEGQAGGWMEVQGAPAEILLPWARAALVLTSCISSIVASWAAFRTQLSTAKVAQVLLVPGLAFVAFNQVLSPQYMIWLLPLAALASLERTSYLVIAIFLAAILSPLTPIFCLSSHFGLGWDWYETVLLVFRNLLLVTAWGWLIFLLLRETNRLAVAP